MKLSIEKALKINGYIIYTTIGTSMLPLLKEKGEKVYLKPSDEYQLFDIVLFKRRNNTYVLHRIINIKDSVYTVIGDNATYIDYLNKNDILAKLVGIFKNNKIISINKIDKINPYSNKKIREDLLNNPSSFFLKRKKDAYYSLIRLATLGNYDDNTITRLTPNELLDLARYLSLKKGLHILGFAILKHGLKLNDYNITKIAIDNYQSSLARISKLEYTIDKVCNAFDNKKINHIFLKGSEIRSLYKYPFLRNSSDVDVYVDKKDLTIAKEILINDLQCEKMNEEEDENHDVSFMFKRVNIKIELHFSISSFLPKDLRYLLINPFKNATKDKTKTYRYHLNKKEEALYSVVHTAKHIKVAQFWYNSIIDYYYLKNNINEKLIEEARLTTFNKCLYNYVNHIYEGSVLNENEQTFEDILFTNADKLSKIINTRKEGKLKYLLLRVFVPYKQLKTKYSILNKYHILFPFISVYRWITLPFRISKEGKHELQALKKENDIFIDKLKNIGLEEYLNNN